MPSASVLKRQLLCIMGQKCKYISLSASEKMASRLEVGLNWHHTQTSWKMRRQVVHILYVINPYWKMGYIIQDRLPWKSIQFITISNGVTQEFQPCDHKRGYGRSILPIWRALHDILNDKVKLQNIIWFGDAYQIVHSLSLGDRGLGSFWRKDSILICLEFFDSFFFFNLVF